MSMSFGAPAWQTSELDEEWPEQSSSDSPSQSPSQSPSTLHTLDIPSRQTSIAIGTREKEKSDQDGGQGTPFRVVSGHTNLSMGSLLGRPPIGITAQDGIKEKRRLSEGGFHLSPPSSAENSSCESRAPSEEPSCPAGTFLVRPVSDDDDVLPKQLRNPFLPQQGGAIAGGFSGDGFGEGLFKPLALESMFKPPSPAVVIAPKEDSQVQGKSAIPEPTIGSPPNYGSRSSNPSSTLRRTSHSYVPARPSRLSESMSPASLNGGSNSGDITRSDDGDDQNQIKDSNIGGEENKSSAASIIDTKQQREEHLMAFSGEIDSMKEVSFTFSPQPNKSISHMSSPDGSLSTTPIKALRLFSLKASTFARTDYQPESTPLAGRGSASKSRQQFADSPLSIASPSCPTALIPEVSASGPEVQVQGDNVNDEIDSLEEDLDERRTKRIRLDSPSASASPSISNSSVRKRLRYRDGSVSTFDTSSGENTVSASSRSNSLNQSSSFGRISTQTNSPKFCVGSSSPQGVVPVNGLYQAGHRQSWEQRGVEMLHNIRNRLLVKDTQMSGAISPSTNTHSGDGYSRRESEGDGTADGTFRERSFDSKNSSLRDTDDASLSPANVIAPEEQQPFTRTSSANTAIYIGNIQTRKVDQHTTKPQSRAIVGGTVNSLGSGSSGTLTGSGSNSTVTSKYLSAGKDIMDRIRVRKISESSGTMTGPDHDGSASSPDRPLESRSESPKMIDPGHNESEAVEASGVEIKIPAARDVKKAASTSSLSATSTSHSHPSSVAPGRPPTLATNAVTDDMNRYISTASTGTHLTQNTAISTSFVKHRGPPCRPKGLTSMGFADVPPLPQQVGRMIFDSNQLKWVKATGTRGTENIGTVLEEAESSEGSLDIFAGLDSLRDEGVSRRNGSLLEGTRATWDRSVQSAQHTEEKAKLDLGSSQSQSQDQSDSASLFGAINNAELNRSVGLMSSSDAGDKTRRLRSKVVIKNSGGDSCELIQTSLVTRISRPNLKETQSDPTPLRESASVSTTPLRSALRNAAPTTYMHEEQTPNAGMRQSSMVDSVSKRNVSFSDGYILGQTHTGSSRSGKEKSYAEVKGNMSQQDGEMNDVFSNSIVTSHDNKSIKQLQASVRSHRIQGLIASMGNETTTERTPSRVSRRVASPLTGSSSETEDDMASDSGHITEQRSHRIRRNNGDATFLTECSFAVSHDKLVEIITEVQPFEPYWEDLTTIDLSRRGATSVARLKEFLPKLDRVNLSDNGISYLSGIPGTVRTLIASGNVISSLTAVNHLSHLQYLDLSRNDLDGVNALSCLRHLRELKLDSNRIVDITPLLEIDSLVKISCCDNRVAELDLRQAQWQRLESLDFAHNNISGIYGTEKLTALTSLSLESNDLCDFVTESPVLSLRILKISNNRICDLDLTCFPKIRTLYADGNCLQNLSRSNPRTASRLENLSLRNQKSRNLVLTYDDLREVKRLYISGNPLDERFFPSRPLYALAYLEAAACKLSMWPVEFARNMPNLRHLNLNYNFFRDLSGIEGLQGLRKFSMIGGCLGAKDAKDVVGSLKGLAALECVDLRMNPRTLNFYLPIILANGTTASALSPNAPQLSSDSSIWAHMDVGFRRSLPDGWYSKRLMYRGLVSLACESIQVIDGLQITKAEKLKAIRLLDTAYE